MTAAQNTVLDVLSKHGPLPDHALVPLVQHVAQARMSSSGIRTRRDELVKAKMVKQTGTMRMPSGRLAAIWSA